MKDKPVVVDQTKNTSAQALGVDGPVLLVNVFTPKPGQTQQFIDTQTAEYQRLSVDGWVANRLGRAVDGDKLVNVAVFESIEKYNAWRDSEAFAEHLKIVSPFIDESAPGMYEILYSAGDMP